MISGEKPFGRVDAVRLWRDLATAPVNYAASEVREPSWILDTHRSGLPPERPGSPEPGGPWEHACRLVRDYEFSPPGIVRALYDPAAPLLGRTMLLEARFHGLHFYCGVRITEVVDGSEANGDRAWGWAYETLDGHLERGKVTYEVVKRGDSGRVEFVVSSHSQPSPTLGRVTALGWRLFGRSTQLRFYRECGRRLRAFVEAGPHGAGPPLRRGPLVCAPSDATFRLTDALAIHRVAPG